jgi:hypothetical protein
VGGGGSVADGPMGSREVGGKRENEEDMLRKGGSTADRQLADGLPIGEANTVRSYVVKVARVCAHSRFVMTFYVLNHGS